MEKVVKPEGVVQLPSGCHGSGLKYIFIPHTGSQDMLAHDTSLITLNVLLLPQEVGQKKKTEPARNVPLIRGRWPSFSDGFTDVITNS